MARLFASALLALLRNGQEQEEVRSRRVSVAYTRQVEKRCRGRRGGEHA